MNKDLKEMLLECCPKMFKQKDLQMEIRDGWFLIVLDVCMCIQHYIDDNKKRQIKITKIKKEGSELKIYTKDSDRRIQGMIWFAEYLSWLTCETCGLTFDIIHKNNETICENCAKKSEE